MQEASTQTTQITHPRMIQEASPQTTDKPPRDDAGGIITDHTSNTPQGPYRKHHQRPQTSHPGTMQEVSSQTTDKPPRDDARGISTDHTGKGYDRTL